MSPTAAIRTTPGVLTIGAQSIPGRPIAAVIPGTTPASRRVPMMQIPSRERRMGLSPTHSHGRDPVPRVLPRGDGVPFARPRPLPGRRARSPSCIRPVSTAPPRTSTSSSARPTSIGCCAASAEAGYEADLVFSHWLAKIRSPSGFVDVIFSSGNGVAVVDDGWFEHATEREVARRPGAGRPARGERLVQGVRHGAGAVRRRGRRPHHPGRTASGSTGAG